MALGCSNEILMPTCHIAHECGIELDLICPTRSPPKPQPAISPRRGIMQAEDLEGAGGVYAVMKELTKKGLLDTSVLTCTGKTLAENLRAWINRNS